MTSIRKALAICIMTTVFSISFAFAQGRYDNNHHDNDHYVRHNDWHKGSHINHDDWNRGQQIDYRQHHLNAPPRGYQWREVDGNYVLAAAATGLISSIIIASAAH